MPKPQGSLLAWSDADLDALATVGPADEKPADALWRLLTLPWARDLLAAHVEEPHV
jgi:hypothetical protein